ncbi:MAG: aldehyde dehydrogenase family protein [Fimbriimonadaceae bacterium]
MVKAPSTGTLSTLLLGRIIKESGCPDGVVNVINCVPALAEKAALDPRIKMLSFTGSPKVGWMLKEKLPRKKVALELGGDATAILTETADLDHAIKKLIPSAFGYAGQICISTQHILVHDSLYEQAKELLIEATNNCPTGNPTDENVICGPVINDDSADRIMEWIDEAESQGATVLAGGQRTGRVIEPVLIESVTRKMRLGCQEVFGPVVTLNRYSTDQEAIDWINASEFGIHHAVFSADREQVDRFYQEIECGGLIVNDAPSLRFDAMPYGGVKNSGYGREGIIYTMQEMTEPKAIIRS